MCDITVVVFEQLNITYNLEINKKINTRAHPDRTHSKEILYIIFGLQGYIRGVCGGPIELWEIKGFHNGRFMGLGQAGRVIHIRRRGLWKIPL